VGLLPRRQRRLRGVSYVGYHRYFATTCTALRRPVFNQRWIATDVTSQLRRTASLCDFALPTYCLMPDHVHVLLYGKSELADLSVFMKRFKQATAFNYKQQTGQVLWQMALAMGFCATTNRANRSPDTSSRTRFARS
jgi:REP element-mobilizing transposase RayT